jgi:hypothetical protein
MINHGVTPQQDGLRTLLSPARNRCLWYRGLRQKQSLVIRRISGERMVDCWSIAKAFSSMLSAFLRLNLAQLAVIVPICCSRPFLVRAIWRSASLNRDGYEITSRTTRP